MSEELVPVMNDEQSLADQAIKASKTITTAVYALQALSFFVGITILAAIIINYVKLEDVQGTWLESHFRWQMRTFWFGLLWSVVGVISLSVFVGLFVLLINFIWVVYRVIKGWLRLVDNKAMYCET